MLWGAGGRRLQCRHTRKLTLYTREHERGARWWFTARRRLPRYCVTRRRVCKSPIVRRGRSIRIEFGNLGMHPPMCHFWRRLRRTDAYTRSIPADNGSKLVNMNAQANYGWPLRKCLEFFPITRKFGESAAKYTQGKLRNPAAWQNNCLKTAMGNEIRRLNYRCSRQFLGGGTTVSMFFYLMSKSSFLYYII